jgi:3-phenylpropionate/cinnamic acid dioxygenase small subunit
MSTASDARLVAGLLHEVTQFLYEEARLADESRYDEWLALWDDGDVRYWVPSGRADYDPATRISYVNDNRARLETRVRQLGTGRHYAQTPPSPMRRVVSNVELLETAPEIEVGSNFVLYEHSIQASGEIRLWAGRATHRLRRDADARLRIATKTVELVNATRALPTMAFLL